MQTSLSRDFDRLQRGFHRFERDGLAWVSAPAMLALGVQHGCSTRRGGVSKEPGLDSLNLGWNRQEDAAENVRENYRRLASAVGFSYDSMALVAYEHGGNICLADRADGGKGFGKGAFSPCDGLITADPALTMITLHADCMPLFLYAPDVNGGGMVHAGWKGTALRIGQRAVDKICASLGGSPEVMFAAVGPCICQEHFEVDAPVVDRFREAFSDVAELNRLPWLEYKPERQKYHIDLSVMMAIQLMLAGLRPENITLAGECTYSQKEDYYSYRRDGKRCGAMAGFLRVKG